MPSIAPAAAYRNHAAHYTPQTKQGATFLHPLQGPSSSLLQHYVCVHPSSYGVVSPPRSVVAPPAWHILSAQSAAVSMFSRTATSQQHAHAASAHANAARAHAAAYARLNPDMPQAQQLVRELPSSHAASLQQEGGARSAVSARPRGAPVVVPAPASKRPAEKINEEAQRATKRLRVAPSDGGGVVVQEEADTANANNAPAMAAVIVQAAREATAGLDENQGECSPPHA